MTRPELCWGRCEVCGFIASAVSLDGLRGAVTAHAQAIHPTTVVALHAASVEPTSDR